MKREIEFVLLSAFFIVVIVTPLAAQIDTLWTNIYSGPGAGFDQPEGIAVDLNGNCYVTGTVSYSGDNSDFGTVKYTSDGIQEWVSYYDGPVDDDWPKAIAIDDSGTSVYVVGYTQVSGAPNWDWDWIVVKIDAETGDTIWTRQYGSGTPFYFEAALHVAVGPSEDVYVGGMAESVISPGIDAFTIRKYDKYGNFLGMIQGYDAPGACPGVMVVDDDENVYLTGVSQIPTTIVTEKYNKFLGLQWSRFRMDMDSKERVAVAMDVDASGSVYIVGFCNGSWHGVGPEPADTIPDYFILSYDAGGVFQYWREYSYQPQDSSDAATGVVVDSAGQYIYVTGFGNGRTSSLRDIWTMKVETATGDTVWTRGFNGPANSNDVTAGWNEFDIPPPLSIPIVMNPAQNLIYVTGSTEEIGSSFNDFLLLVYDTDGNLFDSHILDVGYDDEPEEIAMGSSGNPYVTGIGEIMAIFDDFFTVKYYLSGDYPPLAPYIYAEKTSGKDSVRVQWNAIDVDTLGNPLTIDYYSIFGSGDPAFVPGPANLVADISDTFFIEPIPSYGTNVYYLVFATSTAGMISKKSNMGYAFWRSFNENPSATDKNLVSIPWHSQYPNISDLTNEFSPAGEPLRQATNLRDDQYYESWTWDDVFLMWTGTDFGITPGRGYEMVTLTDTMLLVAGSNNPEGMIQLNENPSAADKNWVSIPYNAAYANVSDITNEYSPGGDPLIQVTNLRDDQYYESWTWDDLFFIWGGTDFSLDAGRSYEFVTMNDTIWDPTEHSNVAMLRFSRNKERKPDVEVLWGNSSEKLRYPAWKETESGFIRCHNKETPAFHEPGISHVVRCYGDVSGMQGICFTAYRPIKPFDVLTEGNIGTYMLREGSHVGLGFNVGNFDEPWTAGEEVILIVEGERDGSAYFGVCSFVLDGTVDIQDLGTIQLSIIPEPWHESGCVVWEGVEVEGVLGYSLYEDGETINDEIIGGNRIAHTSGNVELRLVFRGGHETVYGSGNASVSHASPKPGPVAFSFETHPNPMVGRATIRYVLPQADLVTIEVFDALGRRVAVLVDQNSSPGCYIVEWNRTDGHGKRLASGIYYIRMRCGSFSKVRKIVLLQ